MKKTLIKLFLFLFLFPNFLLAQDEEFNISEVKELGIYKEIINFPENMGKKFSTNCSSIKCRGTKARKEVYYRFVQKKSKSSKLKYPGKTFEAMAWYELFFVYNLNQNDLYLKRYLKNYPSDYKEKKIDELKILNLISMNKARKSMRKAIQLEINEQPEIAIRRFWAFSEYLGKGKPKQNTVKPELKKRKEILNQYKVKINELKDKIKEQQDENE